MERVKNGDKIVISYIGKLSDGEIFDQTEGDETFEFTVGAEEVIEGLEKAVIGMAEGEKKVVAIEPEEAYGEVFEDLIIELPKESAPDNIELELGNVYTFPLEGGEKLDMELVEIDEEGYVFDGNHPLAGETLHFEIELLKIN
ncbi:MAG TPA: FKBP-type peptidyl-prolyl cis-trans isomerase [Melioribacteraceae bacterium]|nr:FKBP-type peptidyl-prolyl cis-trans isomerase [Melioribacteraceae bacterium]